MLGTPEAVMPHARAFLWSAASAGAVPTVTGLVQPIMESVTALTAIVLWARQDSRSASRRQEGVARRTAEAKA